MGPLTSLYAGRTASTGTPSLTLNTPSDTATGVSTTPTLDFTGITSTGDQNISYEVQVDTVNTFDTNASTPAKVQEQTIVDATATPATGTMGAAFTAGNLVIVTTVVSISTANIVSAVNDGVNSYTKIIEKNDAVGGQSISVWYAWNVSAATNMSITFNDASTNLSAIVREYSGILASADPLDKSAGTTGSSTAPNSGSTATTSNSHDLIFGAFTDSHGTGQTYALGSGFGNLTSIINGSTWSVAIEDKNVTSTGTYSANATLGTSAPWTAAVVAFKAATLPLIDAFSASGGHDAAQFADVTNPGDVDPFPSSDQISFTVPTGEILTASTTYYWRSQMVKPTNNVNYLQGFSSTFSFTTSGGGTSASVTQAAATLTFAGGTQAVATTRLVSISQSAATLTFAGGTQAVASVQKVAISQSAATLTFAGGTQAIATVNDVAIAQQAATLTFSGGTQTAVVFATASITQSAATLTFSGGTQAVATVNIVAVSQVAATLTFTGGTQVVATVRDVSVTQVAATLTFAGGTQAEATVNNVAITQSAASLTFTGGTQAVTSVQNVAISQSNATLTFTGGTQSIATVNDVAIAQTHATLTFTGGIQVINNQTVSVKKEIWLINGEFANRLGTNDTKAIMLDDGRLAIKVKPSIYTLV